MLKQYKVRTLAPTCFGSSKDHHQGDRKPAQQADMPP